MPSLVAASVSVCHWSRPWWPETSDSERVSVYLHGLPSRRATARVANSSGVVCSLPPNPPPTSGAMTRTFDSGMPVVAAMRKRRMCGIWVAVQMTICSPVGSTTVDRGSMKAGTSRCWRYSRSMTMPFSRASSMAASDVTPRARGGGVELPERRLVRAEVGVRQHLVLAAASRASSTAGSSS